MRAQGRKRDGRRGGVAAQTGRTRRSGHRWCLGLAVLLGIAGPGAASAAELEQVTLEAAVTRALRRNPTVQAALADAQRAAAVVEQVRAQSLPTLSANGMYTRLDDDRRIGDQVFVPANQISGNLTVSAPLVAPQRWVLWAYARDQRQAAMLDVAAVRRQVGVSVAHAYLAVLAEQRVVEVAERARASATEHHSYALKRQRGGVGSQLDEVRAHQQLREEESRLSKARSTLAQAQGTLGALLGEERPVGAGGPVNLAAPGAGALDDLLAQMPSLRADLRAQTARIGALSSLVRRQWTDYLPSMGAVFTPMYQDPASLVQPKFAWQFQLQLSVPLYDGGLRYGLLHERRAQIASARANLDGVVQRARIDLRVGLDVLQHAERARGEAVQAAELAHRAVEIAALSYRLGAATNLELIDAQRRARDADTAAVLAEDDVQRARLDLLAASGHFPAAEG